MFKNNILFSDIKKVDNIFSEYYFITSKDLYELFIDKLHNLSNIKKFIFIEDFNFNNQIKKNVIGFGGGTIADLTKEVALKNNLDYIIIPSSLSCDAFYTNICILKNDKHLYCKSPKLVLFDFEILKLSPSKMLISGFCDVIANKNSLREFRLGKESNFYNENETLLSEIFAEESYKILERINKISNNKEFLESLAKAIIFSGLSEQILGNTHIISGTEHLFCHAIDFLYPKNRVLHGIKVAYGLLLLEKMIKENYFHKLFKKHKIMKYLKEDLFFIKDENAILRVAERIGKEQKKYSIIYNKQ